MKHSFALGLAILLLPSATFYGAAPQAAPAAQAGDSPISFNIDNTDIYQVIDIIAQALNLNYVVDPAVKGTVNIHTGTTLQRADLLPILETILKINGATMIRSGNFYQIVPAGAAIRQPLSIQQNAPGASPDDQMTIQIVRMKFVSATEMDRLLKPFLSDGGTISVHDSGNILLIADRLSNLRKLLEIVGVFDSNSFEGERIRQLPVRNATARDVVDDLKTIFGGIALSDQSAVRFVPMERTNSILVVTPNPEVFPIVEKWLTQLDQPLATGGFRTFVYKAKHSRALDLQTVLSQLYGVGYSLAAPVAGVPNGPAAALQPQQPPTAGNPLPSPQRLSVPTAGAAGSGDVRIIADEKNNALLIQATQQIYNDIERTLRDLDVQKRQVLIDAQIYEVALDDSMSLGISAFLQNNSGVTRSTTASFATSAGSSVPSLNVQTFIPVGRMRELLLFINAQENRSRIRTLSNPSVLVSDNLQAEFQVGAEIPVPTSSSVTPVQSEGTNLFAQTIQFRNTGVILKVKPQVNDGGAVTLEIGQEVSQAAANTTSGIVAPVIGKSSVTSTIVVENGQTIALGGFIRENTDYDRSRVPLIGRIPVVGLLFGNTSKAHARSELIILITPHVLENRSQADLATDELKTKLKEIQSLLK